MLEIYFLIGISSVRVSPRRGGHLFTWCLEDSPIYVPGERVIKFCIDFNVLVKYTE